MTWTRISTAITASKLDFAASPARAVRVGMHQQQEDTTLPRIHFTYRAVISRPPDDTPCACASCDWTGLFLDLVEIGEADLDLGDPSPAGRCPEDECRALAYPVPPPPNPNLRTILCVSLDHLPAYERHLLAGGHVPGQISTHGDRGELGGVIHLGLYNGLPLADIDAMFADLPKAQKLLEHAIELGCAYVDFDPASPHLAKFPIFSRES